MQNTFDLLEALVESWLAASTTRDIGTDPEKIRLLKAVRDEYTGENKPSETVQDLYREVFLRDVWSRERRRIPRGEALAVSG